MIPDTNRSVYSAERRMLFKPGYVGQHQGGVELRVASQSTKSENSAYDESGIGQGAGPPEDISGNNNIDRKINCPIPTIDEIPVSDAVIDFAAFCVARVAYAYKRILSMNNM